MRLVFYNLQYQEIFSNTLKSYITNKSKSPGGKYSYLFNEFYDLFDEIYLYCGKNYISSMNSFNFEKLIPKKMELKLWMKINNFKSDKVKFIDNLTSLPDDTIVFGNARTLIELENLDELKNSNFKKVFFLSHFFYKTLEQSKSLKKINVDLIVSENNLFKNSIFFKKYFKFYKKDVYLNPFVPQKRFVLKKKFNDRENMCIATGTWRKYSGENFNLFLDYYNVNTLHPGRKEIGENRIFLKNEVVNLMSNDFDNDTYKIVNSSDIFLKKLYKRFYNVYFVKKSYFNTDIVEQYNNYKMAVIPEEVIQVPGIGFSESMMCGCVFFGKHDPMYTDIGMVPNKHYITYIDYIDLKNKINYFQNNSVELEKIQLNSIKFAKDNFNSKFISKNFYNYIKNNL